MLFVACAGASVEVDAEGVKGRGNDRVEVRDATLHVLLDPDHFLSGKVNKDLDTGRFAILGLSCDQDAHVRGTLEPLFQAIELLVDVRTEGGGHFKVVTFDGNLHSSLLHNLHREEFSIEIGYGR